MKGAVSTKAGILGRRDLLQVAASSIAVSVVTGCRSASSNGAPANTSMRAIERTLQGMPTSDGAGVKLTRAIGQPTLRNLDPFLMLDRFHSDDPTAYIAGFPDHPHRGFETVTVMRHGMMQHKDSRGNQGLIRGGGVQWMTAGRGIVHSEMPKQDRGLMSGFQLWLNLPKDEKMCAPAYQDLQPEALTHVGFGRASNADVISGDWFGKRGPVRPRPSDPLLAYITLAPGDVLETPIPLGHRSFLFVDQGSATALGTTITREQLAIFGDGERVRIEAGEQGAGLLLAAGKPFGEPIMQYGPFVMNTQAEIETAFREYRNGTLGHD
jgi:quercetin 2,3-dioxygenase